MKTLKTITRLTAAILLTLNFSPPHQIKLLTIGLLTVIIWCGGILLPIFIGINCFAQANESGSGNALSFNGTSDWIEINSIASNLGVGDRTISCWIQTIPKTDHCLFSFNTNTGGNALLWNVGPTGVLQFWDNATSLFGTKVITDNEWHHAAYTYHSSTGTVTQYIDGVLDAQGIENPAFAANNRVSIGQEWDSNSLSAFFIGQIDEFRIWNKVLTQNEIKNNMCKKLTGNEPGLVGYWRMDEGTGTTVFDSSPNGNNGTLF